VQQALSSIGDLIIEKQARREGRNQAQAKRKMGTVASPERYLEEMALRQEQPRQRQRPGGKSKGAKFT